MSAIRVVGQALALALLLRPAALVGMRPAAAAGGHLWRWASGGRCRKAASLIVRAAFSMTESPEPGYELVMPFIVCKSEGGPYDDAAFVAGAQMQGVCHALEAGPTEYATYSHPALVPQLDLVAMHYGFAMTQEHYSDEWVLCSFTPVSAS